MASYGGADRSYFWQNVPPEGEKQISLDFEGGVLLNKAAAGLVPAKDTLDAHILMGMPYGRNEAEASLPTLESPTYLLRESKLRKLPDRQKYKYIQKRLKRFLPDDLIKKISQSKKENNLTFLGLKKALHLLSIFTFWMQSSAQIKLEQKNYNVANIATKNLLVQCQNLIRDGSLFLQNLNRNHPQYDTLSHFLRQLSLIATKLSKNDSSLISYTESLSQELKENKEMHDLMMVEVFVKKIGMINKIKTMGSLQSLSLGFMVGNLSSSHSQIPLYKESFRKFIDYIANIFSHFFHSPLSYGKKSLFIHSFKSLFLFVILSAISLMESKFIPEENETNNLLSENNQKRFSNDNYYYINGCALENLIQFVLGFDLITPLFDNSLNSDEKVVFKQAIEGFLILLIVKTLHIKYPTLIEGLLLNISDELTIRLRSLEIIFDTAKKKMRQGVPTKKMMENNISLIASSALALDHANLSQFNQLTHRFFANFNLSSNRDWLHFYGLSLVIDPFFTSDLKELNHQFSEIVKM